ncbi:ligand dependent nuclear receptor interacting factor 1 [Cricetulus griseus]
MYQVVQMVGTDGKNLLKLLPIPKSSGNFTPVVQSPVVSDALKRNTGKPVQVTFQAQISSSSTSASVQLPIFQPADTTKCILTETIDTPGKGGITSVGTGSFIPPVSKVESHDVKIDGLNMQTFAIPPSTQDDSSHFVVSTPSLPVNVNSPVLPPGPHLQIPVHAEVKSIPELTLSPSVRQNIHATTTRSPSGNVEASQIPTVIYVSPANKVTNRVTKSFQKIYPKPVILNTAKIPPNVATETQLKSGQHSDTAQMKIIFQESLQTGIPSLVPVKSSNNVDSKISKTFIGRKKLRDNTINTPPLNTISSNGTQSISVPIKDNTLVMLNGKVYLLTKEGTHGLPSQNDHPNSVSSGNPLRKDSSQVVSSSPGTEISKELNSAFIQSKSCQLETKSLSNSQLASLTSLRAEKNETVARPSFSMASPHTVNQSSNYHKQSKTVFTDPVGFRTVQNAPRKGNLIQSIEKICSSVDAATVTSQQCVFRDQELQTQCEMASMLKKNTEERNKKYSEGSNTKASYLKSDAELKKLFGLTKDLRVGLTRIPDYLGSRKGSDSVSSLMKSSSYKDAEFVVKEEEIKQSFSKKRRAKNIKKMEYTKRRKIKRASDTVMNGTDVASSQLLSILPTSEVPQHNIVTSHSTTREDKRTEVEHCSHEKQDKGTLSSSVSFEQTQEGNYHNNGAHNDENIAQCQEGKVTEEYSIGVLDQEEDTKAQNATATDLKGSIP